MKPTEGNCNICLEDFTPENNSNCIQTLCCKKYFHKNCIEKWTGTCPICRGIWKEGLQPRTPVVTYPEDFTEGTRQRHGLLSLRRSLFGRELSVTTSVRTSVTTSVTNSRHYPNIPPTFRETRWTTTYQTSYRDPNTVVDRPLARF